MPEWYCHWISRQGARYNSIAARRSVVVGVVSTVAVTVTRQAFHRGYLVLLTFEPLRLWSCSDRESESVIWDTTIMRKSATWESASVVW